MAEGLIFDIKRFAVHDGPGIRTTVFFKGCPLNCSWCHNPESISPDPESVSRTITLDGKEFIQNEEIGKSYDPDSLLEEILHDKVFYQESNGGVTFSGGEPLLQHMFLKEILQLCKEEKIHTTLDTCGCSPWGHLLECVPFVDLFLYDLKLIDDTLHQKYTGVSNKLVLENLKNLIELDQEVIIRFPVIPGITDTDENLKQVTTFLKQIKQDWKIHLLPYHDTAKAKYKKLNQDYIININVTDLDLRMMELESYFTQNGFDAVVGG